MDTKEKGLTRTMALGLGAWASAADDACGGEDT